MKWVGMLRTWLVGPDLNAVAEDIAAQYRNAVWHRVQHRVGGLPLAEARGYVRIKAAALVQEAVDQRLTEDQSIRTSAAGYLSQLTMEAVLRQAVLDVVHARQRVQQAVAPELRRAA